MSIKEILKKLAVGGFLSGSCDTDIAVEKAEEEIKREINEEREKLITIYKKVYKDCPELEGVSLGYVNFIFTEINKRLFGE